MSPKKSSSDKGASKSKPFRTISKTDLMPSVHHSSDSKPFSSEKENLAIYIVLALAFISLVIYVTQIEPELAVSETTPTAEDSRDTASVGASNPANMDGFSCVTTERFDSDTQNTQIESYLKSNCNLQKPFNFSSSRFGDYKLPKSTICCWKK